jgi:hypothetical protein
MAENTVSQNRMPSPALVSMLRSGRGEFNARFAAARRIHPDLDSAAFAEFLCTSVDELIQAAEKVRPDRLGEVMNAAYDAALELVGQKLVGAGSRFRFVEDAWQRILAKTALVVATSPGRLIPAFCNAAHQLGSTPGARPEQWIQSIEGLAPQCQDAETLLKLGQVCAWRAGLAHFRSGAIAAAAVLPEPLAIAAVGGKGGLSWNNVRERLNGDPWFNPGDEAKSQTGVRVVAQAGSFIGFGGLFMEPPIVAASGDQFLVRSDGECWLLTADAFGATFHRASIKEFEAAHARHRLPTGLQVAGSRVLIQGQRFEFPELGDILSVAANATTLALTSRLTHAIVLLALK